MYINFGAIFKQCFKYLAADLGFVCKNDFFCIEFCAVFMNDIKFLTPFGYLSIASILNKHSKIILIDFC